MIQVSATEYKHNALKLLEQVRVSGEEVQITKRGKPIAVLRRVEDAHQTWKFDQFADVVEIVGDIVGHTVDPALLTQRSASPDDRRHRAF